MKGIAVLVLALLATTAVLAHDEEMVEAELVDEQDAVRDSEGIEVEVEDDSTHEAETDADAEEEGEADAESAGVVEGGGHSDSAAAAKKSTLEAEWVLFRQSTKDLETCKECTAAGLMWVEHWINGFGMCIDKKANDDKRNKGAGQKAYDWAIRSSFPKTEKQTFCDKLKKQATDMRANYEAAKIDSSLALLTANTKSAVTMAKAMGKVEYNNCPSDLYNLYLEQSRLEQALAPADYARGRLTTIAGMAQDTPEYKVDVAAPLAEVTSVGGEMKSVPDLIEAGGYKTGKSLDKMGAGDALKGVQATTRLLAKKVNALELVDAQTIGGILEPAIDIAECLKNPKTSKPLYTMNWPKGNRAAVTIICPVCNAYTLQMAATREDNEDEAKAIEAMAADVLKITAAAKKDAAKYNAQNPFGKTDAGKGLVAFYQAITWMMSDQKDKWDDTWPGEVSAGAKGGSFLAIRERIHSAARHALQP